MQPMIDAKFNRFENTKQPSLSFLNKAEHLDRLFFGLLMLICKSCIFQGCFKLIEASGANSLYQLSYRVYQLCYYLLWLWIRFIWITGTLRSIPLKKPDRSGVSQ